MIWMMHHQEPLLEHRISVYYPYQRFITAFVAREPQAYIAH